MATVYRCSFSSTATGNVQVVNTFHVVVRKDNPLGGEAGIDSVRDALMTALKTKYKSVLASLITLDSFMVREEVDPAGAAIPATSFVNIGEVGTRSSGNNDAPLSLTMLAKLQSNAAVRSGHGRIFMPPPLDHGAMRNGRDWDPLSSYWLTCKAFLDELVLDHSVGGIGFESTISPVIYSRTRRARGDDNYYFDVSGYTIRSAPHWLRSRSTAP